MAGDVATELVERSRQEGWDEVLVVTVYDGEDIYHEYIVDEVSAQSDKIAMDSLHRPVQSLHRTLDFISQLNELGGTHRGSIHFYDHVTYLHFPTDDHSGVIVSLDPRGDRNYEIFARCRTIVGTQGR